MKRDWCKSIEKSILYVAVMAFGLLIIYSLINTMFCKTIVALALLSILMVVISIALMLVELIIMFVEGVVEILRIKNDSRKI